MGKTAPPEALGGKIKQLTALYAPCPQLCGHSRDGTLLQKVYIALIVPQLRNALQLNSKRILILIKQMQRFGITIVRPRPLNLRHNLLLNQPSIKLAPPHSTLNQRILIKRCNHRTNRLLNNKLIITLFQTIQLPPRVAYRGAPPIYYTASHSLALPDGSICHLYPWTPLQSHSDSLCKSNLCRISHRAALNLGAGASLRCTICLSICSRGGKEHKDKKQNREEITLPY